MISSASDPLLQQSGGEAFSPTEPSGSARVQAPGNHVADRLETPNDCIPISHRFPAANDTSVMRSEGWTYWTCRRWLMTRHQCTHPLRRVALIALAQGGPTGRHSEAKKGEIEATNCRSRVAPQAS
ncbi:hypothetical protein Csal_0953 [Chromohalobacter israelensis DSM 3043]|uniref:Uncharacterized protein n=1 Tax=Chromohalobacter israelensis (strain ATCC BAA-138 / DSM 3043 / CIP 106854 / NCIMB 13768 / 1H11) TaxID=290398 RepID=Q1QYZ8_CHRI1|nr:hypothetical protein Csal_0953 [Chromohalobacter salexigens DSM 3043]